MLAQHSSAPAQEIPSTAQHRILPAQNLALALGRAALACAVRWPALVILRWGCAGAEAALALACAGAELR